MANPDSGDEQRNHSLQTFLLNKRLSTWWMAFTGCPTADAVQDEPVCGTRLLPLRLSAGSVAPAAFPTLDESPTAFGESRCVDKDFEANQRQLRLRPEGFR